MKFCPPKVLGKYWLTKLNLRCSRCATEFEVLLPRGDDIVKFREIGGHTIKWLPMHGVGGYLDLLAKLVPSYEISAEVTMKTAKVFAEALARVTETSAHGMPFGIDYGRSRCPTCGSVDLVELSEEILENPHLDWLRVSCDLQPPSEAR